MPPLCSVWLLMCPVQAELARLEWPVPFTGCSWSILLLVSLYSTMWTWHVSSWTPACWIWAPLDLRECGRNRCVRVQPLGALGCFIWVWSQQCLFVRLLEIFSKRLSWQVACWHFDQVVVDLQWYVGLKYFSVPSIFKVWYFELWSFDGKMLNM